MSTFKAYLTSQEGKSIRTDGELLFSNGFSLFVLGAGGNAQLVRAEEVVGFVTILRPVAAAAGEAAR